VGVHLWGNSQPERRKLLEWGNWILREFASAWAERLLYLDYGEPHRDPSTRLRDRLNPAAAATLAYGGMSASSVSEVEEMIKPLMIQTLAEIGLRMEIDLA
jgi:hypothetical protein